MEHLYCVKQKTENLDHMLYEYNVLEDLLLYVRNPMGRWLSLYFHYFETLTCPSMFVVNHTS